MKSALCLGSVLAAGLVPGQTFKSSADAVTVDVSVTRDSRWVSGLAASDFEVLDNGVPQKVLDASVESMPIDVIVLLDVSQTMLDGYADQLSRGIAELASALTPPDQRRVVRFGSLVQSVDSPESLLASLPPQGRHTALFDALTVVAAQRPTPGFRRLIVAVTDGVDTMSFLDVEPRARVMDRSEATIHLIAIRATRRPRTFGAGEEQTYDWILADVTDRTGGRLYTSRPGEDYGPVLRAAIDEFRKRYVISYTPTGVSAIGWHDLRVRVVKPGRHDVRARRGYYRGGPEPAEREVSALVSDSTEAARFPPP